MRKFLLAALAAASAFVNPAFADRIVIVHGAFQNAAAWSEVEKLLEAQGHDVDLVDLPGRDAKGDLKAINLAAYRDAARAVIDGKPEPVYLVGHSFGGFTISAVAEAAPASVKKLIYVAAYVPVSGESMQSLSAQDKNNKFTQQNFVVAKDYSYAEVLEADRGLIFANDGSSEIQARVTKDLLKEPLAPVAEPLTLTAAFGGVAKAYIRTTGDNAVSTPLQDMMIERAGLKQVISIDAGHSPFITAPQATADAIIAAMGKQ
jgi:pimeloyl-ACP methyl ester carboxylesterase